VQTVYKTIHTQDDLKEIVRRAVLEISRPELETFFKTCVQDVKRV